MHIHDFENNREERKIIDSISIDDQEAISNSNYLQLIQEAAKNNSSLIIGRIRTRDKADFRKKYFHNYYGPNLIKILFKTFNTASEQILRSRYHVEFPLNPKDPLTNQVIVGEVEFYMIKAEEI